MVLSYCLAAQKLINLKFKIRLGLDCPAGHFRADFLLNAQWFFFKGLLENFDTLLKIPKAYFRNEI